MLKLIGSDSSRYYAWDMQPGTYEIGRKTGKADECDLAISDRAVSRRHAQLEIMEDGRTCYLTDMGSHNGTVVNGERISERIQLKIGDHVQLGQTEFRLSDSDNSSAGMSRPENIALSDEVPSTSVMLTMDEALKPLPARMAESPEILQVLSEMARMLVLTEPQEDLLKRSLELVSKIIPSERLAVLFRAEKDGTGIYPAATVLTEGRDPGSFNLSRTIVNKILTDKSAILISDAAHDPRFAEQKSIIMSAMKSAMAVPLFDEGKVLGILYADTTDPRHLYTNEFLRLFAIIGNIIASRLTNINLLQERAEKQVYEAELNRASKIQQDLLPRKIPEIEGYSICALQEQCRAVGGDLYDITLLEDGRLLFLLADVSGKGMGAALIMSNILASFRILYGSNDLQLSRLVQQVSAQLCSHSATDNFATLFIGVLDPANNLLNYVNCGHNPPCFVRSNGEIEHLEPGGMMIGIIPGCRWEEKQTEFGPGDQLVIFTDGVTEAGVQDEEYSDERLERLLVERRDDAPKSLCQRIVTDIDEFTNNAPRSDDVTLLIIKKDK